MSVKLLPHQYRISPKLFSLYSYNMDLQSKEGTFKLIELIREEPVLWDVHLSYAVEILGILFEGDLENFRCTFLKNF